MVPGRYPKTRKGGFQKTYHYTRGRGLTLITILKGNQSKHLSHK